MAIGFTAAELASIRATHSDSLSDDAIIYRRTLVSDGQEGFLSTYAELARCKCRLAFESGTRPVIVDAAQGEKIDARERIILTLPYDQSIAETDRVEVSGTTFEVITADNPRSYVTAKRFLVKRV